MFLLELSLPLKAKVRIAERIDFASRSCFITKTNYFNEVTCEDFPQHRVEFCRKPVGSWKFLHWHFREGFVAFLEIELALQRLTDVSGKRGECCQEVFVARLIRSVLQCIIWSYFYLAQPISDMATSIRNGDIVGNGDINFVTPLS